MKKGEVGKGNKRKKKNNKSKILASASSDGSLDDLGFDWDRGGVEGGEGGDLSRWSEDVDDDDDDDDDDGEGGENKANWKAALRHIATLRQFLPTITNPFPTFFAHHRIFC
jgi:hypothetical protein